MRNRMHEIALHLVQSLEIRDVLHGDGRSHFRDRGMLGIEHAPVVKIQLIILNGAIPRLGEQGAQFTVSDHVLNAGGRLDPCHPGRKPPVQPG